MSTPHNTAEKGDFAKTVLMPGDPLRAKFIADNYLENKKLVNSVRGINGYTGFYKGKKVSVMASGMGMPSIGIYAHELFTQYGVESIIRVGTAGGYSENVKVRDIVLVMGACTNSSWAHQYSLNGTFAPLADFGLLLKAKQQADNLNVRYSVGSILSSDIFYEPEGTWKSWAAMGVLGVEMETAALYMIAAQTKKKALSVLTISDHFIYTEDETTSEERERTMTDMMKIALEIAEE